jgi:hypothetical protein
VQVNRALGKVLDQLPGSTLRGIADGLDIVGLA